MSSHRSMRYDGPVDGDKEAFVSSTDGRRVVVRTTGTQDNTQKAAHAEWKKTRR